MTIDSDCELRDNTAFYGNHIASFGVLLYKVDDSNIPDFVNERVNKFSVKCPEECFLGEDSEKSGCGFCERYVS